LVRLSPHLVGPGVPGAPQTYVAGKTDINDAMWLAELLALSLIRASFVPNAQTRRCTTCCARASNWFVSWRLRVQKTLKNANIKVNAVLTDVVGKSGRAMIEQLPAKPIPPNSLLIGASRRQRRSFV
jgi:transposase